MGICTDDVVMWYLTDYLYINITDLNKPINVDNIVNNEWKQYKSMRKSHTFNNEFPIYICTHLLQALGDW